MTRDGRPPDNHKPDQGKAPTRRPRPARPAAPGKTAPQLPGLGEKCAPPSPGPQSWMSPGTCQMKSDLTEPVRHGEGRQGQAAAAPQARRTGQPPQPGTRSAPETPGQATTQDQAATPHRRQPGERQPAAPPRPPRPPRPRTLAGNASPPESQAHPGKTPGQAASTSKRSQARVRNPRQENRTLKPIHALNSHALVSSPVFE